MNPTETPKTAHIRHRLYVVLPLFLALAYVGVGSRSGASVLPQTFTQSGSLTVAADGHFAVDGGVVSANSDGTIALHGSSLVAGQSFVDVDAAGFHITGWNGVLEIDTSASSKLTVAALTTSALIVKDDDEWIVPVGMQLTIATDASDSLESFDQWVRAHRPLPLPAHYLRERLPQAEALISHTSIPSLPEPAAVLPPLTNASVQLSAAREMAERKDHAQRIWQLSEALNRNDLETFDGLIGDASTTEALYATDVRDLLTPAFAEKRDLQILPILLQNADIGTLLRFHPLTRDRVWLPFETEDHDLLILAQMIQPLSDRSDAPVSQIAVRTWLDGWQSLSANEALAPEMLDTLLPMLAADINTLDAAGYPARARAYATALVTALHPLPADASVSVRGQIDQLRSTYDVVFTATAGLNDAPIEPEIAEVSSSSETSERPIVSDADVRSILGEMGFMFTAQSVVLLRDDGLFDVTGLVIGTAAGDRLTGFVFDPIAGLVSGIEHDGKILPYSMALGKYVEWVKMK